LGGHAAASYYVGEQVLLDERKHIRAGRAPQETSDPFELAPGQLAPELSR